MSKISNSPAQLYYDNFFGNLLKAPFTSCGNGRNSLGKYACLDELRLVFPENVKFSNPIRLYDYSSDKESLEVSVMPSDTHSAIHIAVESRTTEEKTLSGSKKEYYQLVLNDEGKVTAAFMMDAAYSPHKTRIENGVFEKRMETLTQYVIDQPVTKEEFTPRGTTQPDTRATPGNE